MSEFIHKPQPFIQQDPERSERITKQQALFKLQTTVRELRKCDLSYAAIERITTVPRATAHLWASDVEPIRPNPNTSDSTHSDQSTSYDGGDRDSYTPQTPRVSSEVVAPRPIVVEENHPYESHSSISTNDGQSLSSQPLDVDILRLLFSRQPEWIDVFLSIKAASVAAGEKDAIRFFYDQVMTDSEDADFFRAVVPHEAGDQEGLRENFMMIVRQANAYAEAAKRSGLDMRKSVELS